VITSTLGQNVALFAPESGGYYVLADSLRAARGKESYLFSDWFRQHQVMLRGVERPGDTFGPYPVIEVIEITYDPDVDRFVLPKNLTPIPPPQMPQPSEPLLPQAYIEQVELIYLAIPVESTPDSTQPATDPALRIAQPMWRFTGHTENESPFEILVQAVRDEYLKR
jgi:hypothetical protein